MPVKVSKSSDFTVESLDIEEGLNIFSVVCAILSEEMADRLLVAFVFLAVLSRENEDIKS